MFILYIISAQVVPVLVPEPVPEVQVGSASVRAVPEVASCVEAWIEIFCAKIGYISLTSRFLRGSVD